MCTGLKIVAAKNFLVPENTVFEHSYRTDQIKILMSCLVPSQRMRRVSKPAPWCFPVHDGERVQFTDKPHLKLFEQRGDMFLPLCSEGFILQLTVT